MSKSIKNNSAKQTADGSSLLFVCNDLNISAENKTLPTEVDMLIEGSHGNKILANGKVANVVITKADIESAVAFIAARRISEPNREFVLDYDHQTIYGPPPAIAAGWFNDLKMIVRDGVVVARAIISRWTPRASEMILNGEMRYISPVFRQDGFDDFGNYFKCMLFNGALTNEPFLKNMLPLAATKFFNQLNNLNNSIIGGNKMEELLERLRYFLNAQTTATPEELLADLQKLTGQVSEYVDSKKAEDVTASAIVNLLSANKTAVVANAGLQQFRTDVIAKAGLQADAKDDIIVASLVELKTKSEQLVIAQKELNDIKEADFEKEFERVLAASVKAGRLLPATRKEEKWVIAQRNWAKTDFVAFEKHFTETAPVVGPVQTLPHIDNPPAVEDDATVIASKAREYQTEQKKIGNEISISQAVSHVTKKK